MMGLTEDLLEIKRESEQAKQRKSEAQGAFDQCMSQIKKEFGCNTIEEAEKKAEQLQSKENKLRKNLKKKIEQYREDFSEWIEDEEDQETEMELEI